MYTYSVAARYILRRPISYVAIVLVMLVVIMYMVVISVLEGFKNHWMDKIQSIEAHITVDVGNLSWGIENPAGWSAEIATVDPGIRGVTISLATPAMAIFKDKDWRTIGPLRGIDLASEMKYGRIKEILKPESLKQNPEFGIHEVNGRKFRGCLVGGAWRKQFHLEIGDRIVFLFTNDDDEPQTVQFYVIGFFEGTNPYLEQAAYVDRNVLAEYVGHPGTAKSMHLWLNDPNRPDLKQLKQRVREKMETILKRDHPEMLPRLNVETWQEKDNNFYDAVTRENWMMRAIMSFFLMLTSFIFFLIFSRIVAEKVRDIGALRALGASPAGIRKCFLLQGLFVGILGLVLGLILSEVILKEMNPLLKWWGVNLFTQENLAAGEIPYRTLNFDRVLISGVTLFSAFFGALFPALMASWKNPVECLRHE